MLETKPQAKALVQKIDSLIDRYGHDNPQLLGELLALREALETAQRRGTAVQVATVSFRIATWVRFVMDHWHGL